ncbi:MAG TPA: RNA repair transcriptional activator RtcR [Verrucomicrobiales bacterium]|nr:RNA repair transcriptional activator RtcR [Verrucomicrobiales bacterium]
MSKLKTVVLGLLGTRLDAASGADRWGVWRPSISVVQQGDWPVDRFELLYEGRWQEMAERVMADMREASPHTEVRGHVIDTGENPWNFESVYDGLFAFARGYRFDPDKEEYCVHITTGTHVAQICLFLLTESRHLPAKLLQTAPKQRAHSKKRAEGRVDIIDLDLARYDRLQTRFAQEHKETQQHLKSGIATKNKAFNALIERIERVAASSREPLLLTGPTGAGKSQLARRIFELRQRGGLRGKFVEVNCATLRGDAAMSTLFGHVKGAFTGALSDRAGLLREADGGLLFLDEIGELGADEQAMLLRALEDKVFTPFGSDKTARSDFQLIAGTNRDLEERVCDGRFREDLLARLNVWTFSLPGLAERREDIAPNLEYELERFAERQGRKVSFNKEAREAFLKFARSPEAAWRANFRDLNAAVTRMATLATRGRINEALVEEEIDRLRERWRKLEPPNCAPQSQDDDELLMQLLPKEKREDIDLFDRVQLATVIRICRGSRTMAEAGRKLFAASRTQRAVTNDSDRVKKYLARFDLDWKTVTGAE